MKAKIRSIKRTPLGKYSRDRVRNAVAGVHVLETVPGGSWEVRTLGEKGYTKLFAAKDVAIQHAFKVKPGAKVVVHQLEPKKVMVMRNEKIVYTVAIRGTKGAMTTKGTKGPVAIKGTKIR